MSDNYFPPIAIIGRGCVLPGALSPDALWDLVQKCGRAIGPAPETLWATPKQRILSTRQPRDPDTTWSDQGGYIVGFDDVFDPSAYHLTPDQLAETESLTRWLLHATRDALQPLIESGELKRDRCGAIIGNLFLPTTGAADFAESVWSGHVAPHAAQAFSSGLTIDYVAAAFGLRGASFAIDSACASSLYAIKLACDRLHDGEADQMIAGGVSGADDLFLHVGFAALNALSRSGNSLPFHEAADGLVPSHGCAVIVLERLEDAVTSGHSILGVIRGIGLSNDGRQKTLVAPSIEGQVGAMRAAYDVSGLSPSDIDLVECHATGTLTGDAAELASMAQVFASHRGLTIGSLKSNLGHAMTAAGAAGLMKVLSAIEHEILPPTRVAGALVADLERSRFNLPDKAKKWISQGPRRAGVNAFGFGGNNAHLIVEAWQGQSIAEALPSRKKRDLVVIGIDLRRAASIEESMPSEKAERGKISEIDVALTGLKFPPKDVKSALPQQALMFASARSAFPKKLRDGKAYIGVYVGMSCDANTCRYIARLRCPPAMSGEQKDRFTPPLDAARTIGVLGNVVANRINSQIDALGPGIAIAAEEASGLVALKLGVRALSAGEICAAIIGAVDLSCDPVHRAALRCLGIERIVGDGAVTLVLTTKENAEATGCEVLYAFEPGDIDRPIAATSHQDAVYGVSHAAHGLMQFVMQEFGNSQKPWVSSAPSTLASISNAVLGPLHEAHGQDGLGISLRYQDNKLGPDTPAFSVSMHWPEVTSGEGGKPVMHSSNAQAVTREKDNLRSRQVMRATSTLPGPKFDRRDLLTLASGRVSEFFGECFLAQDEFPKQTRMPGPPLLLVDRITGIDAPQGEIGAGSIWSETEVSGDAWYMHNGRMASGVLVESGQADLLLISWMGVDRFNEGQRVYRLLGCEITFHAALPKAGEILSHDIHIDRHVSTGSTRLFFFHSTCRVGGEKRLSITNGQAGFFTEEELNGSRGLFLPLEPPVPPPAHETTLAVKSARQSFTIDEIEAFVSGRVSRCFGPAFKEADRHVNTPRLPSSALRLMHRVPVFDTEGGFWKRGYMKAELDISEESWFFKGHFHNDPCMPGTLILEGGLQVMMFYLAAIGQTLPYDGRRFQPGLEEKILVKCRGQVTPRNKRLTYEFHASSFTLDHNTPRLRGTLLCTVDGLLSFQAECASLCLVSDE